MKKNHDANFYTTDQASLPMKSVRSLALHVNSRTLECPSPGKISVIPLRKAKKLRAGLKRSLFNWLKKTTATVTAAPRETRKPANFLRVWPIKEGAAKFLLKISLFLTVWGTPWGKCLDT